jgi:hypothetical protein
MHDKEVLNNGILVLAESQNLHDFEGHRDAICQKEEVDRFYRLPISTEKIGVGPWDNGVVQLALKAMIPNINLDEVAVSNVVPWSQISPKNENKNVNPSEVLVDKAASFWEALLEVWEPHINIFRHFPFKRAQLRRRAYLLILYKVHLKNQRLSAAHRKFFKDASARTPR